MLSGTVFAGRVTKVRLFTPSDFPYNVYMELPIDRDSLENYFGERFAGARVVELSPLGRGVHGAGFLVTISSEGQERSFVLKGISPEGLGHDYPSDRAGMLLLALDNYGKLPGHVRAIDVLSLHGGGVLKSIGGGGEYFLLMEEARGTTYFKDLEEFSLKETLNEQDRKKIVRMARYLSGIHSVKKKSRALYLRKLRDIIGHGECLMGVFDTYPEGVISPEEMAEVEKMCIDWRARLKSRHERLCQIHGDFHPGNIWWKDAASGDEPELVLLDRSRGPWGEPADDVTALAINYIFFSIKHFGCLRGAYQEGFRLFFESYMDASGDREILSVVAPFFAFRGAVVANPVFYPEIAGSQRALIFDFVRRTLASPVFDYESAGDFILKNVPAV